jgi:threonine dehydrogenase-like Zn-dependent dehydrogenase
VSGVRAAVVEAPGRCTVQRFPVPEPGPGALVLRIEHAGICGTDKHTWRGESLQYAGTPHERQVPYPLICGHENVGVIEAIGPGEAPVDELGHALGVGDRVVPAPNLTCGRCRFCLDERYPYYLCRQLADYGNSFSSADAPHLFGGWAEMMYLLPGTRLFRVPDGLAPPLAALTEIVAVTHGLDAARGLHGTGGGFDFADSVLVLGNGPLGLLHLWKADVLGAGRLMAIDTLPERLVLAEDFGADVLLDASATTAQERLAAVHDATDGLGADVVVHATGHASTLPEALSLVRPGGTVIEPGTFVDMGDVPVNPSRDICTKGVSIIGIGGETLPQYAPALRMLERHADRGPLERLVSHQVGLDEVADALELAQTGAAMKIQVNPALAAAG